MRPQHLFLAQTLLAVTSQGLPTNSIARILRCALHCGLNTRRQPQDRFRGESAEAYDPRRSTEASHGHWQHNLAMESWLRVGLTCRIVPAAQYLSGRLRWSMCEKPTNSARFSSASPRMPVLVDPWREQGKSRPRESPEEAGQDKAAHGRLGTCGATAATLVLCNSGRPGVIDHQGPCPPWTGGHGP